MYLAITTNWGYYVQNIYIYIYIYIYKTIYKL